VTGFEGFEQLSFRPEGIRAPDYLQVTLVCPGRTPHFHFISTGVPVASGDTGDFFLVDDFPEHDQRILESKRAALPLVRLWIQTHRDLPSRSRPGRRHYSPRKNGPIHVWMVTG
jgi:hypothetical protein